MNLTAITEPEAAWERHILDSLSLIPILASLDPEPTTLLDIGSGAGLPGIPLAITLPHLRVHLLDATARKCQFLTHASSLLSLQNISVLHSRAELLGHDPAHRAAYDAVTARALGHLAEVIELSAPFLRPSGVLLAIKGQRAAAELEESTHAAETLLCHHSHTVETPTGRVLVFVQDDAAPALYPRRSGEPKNKPLGVPRKPQ